MNETLANAYYIDNISKLVIIGARTTSEMHVKSDMHESPDNTPGSDFGVLSGSLRAVHRGVFQARRC